MRLHRARPRPPSWPLLACLCALLWCPWPAAAQPSAASLNQEGSRLLQSGDAAAALEKFQAALKLSHGDPAIQYNVGLALFRLGRYQEALAPLERSKAHQPSALPARYLLGIIYFVSARPQACIRELEPLRGDPRFGEHVLYMLVESYRQARNAAEAQKAFAELDARYPDSAFLHKLMGIAYEAQDQDDKALEEFRAAHRKNPQMPEIAFAIGYIQFQHQRWQPARQWLAKELELQPCYARAHHYLGEIAQAEQGWDEAAARYRQALNCDPKLAQSYVGLGTVLERRQRLDEAVKMYREAVRLQPADSQARYKLALALRRAGRLKEAQTEMAKAKELYAAEQEKQARQRRRLPPE